MFTMKLYDLLGLLHGRKLSSQSKSTVGRLRTPSPYGNGRGRFDPTAYVEEKRRERMLLSSAKHRLVVNVLV